MKFAVLALASLLMSSAFAVVPKNALTVAEKIKKNDVRTVLTELPVGDACVEAGSTQIELQVRMATYNPIANKTVYSWETVKSVFVNKNGGLQEVCAE